MIDGATRFQRILHVDLPAILPTAAIMLILRSGSIMTVGFEKVYLMQNDLNLEYSEVIATHVYKMTFQGSSSNKYSYSTAVGLFNSLVNGVLLILVNFITKYMSEDKTSLF